MLYTCIYKVGICRREGSLLCIKCIIIKLWHEPGVGNPKRKDEMLPAEERPSPCCLAWLPGPFVLVGILTG